MEEVIKFENVNKEYFRYKKRTINLIKALFPSNKKNDNKVVLNDLSFSIKRGEKVAIIGRNGSGKSTILKLITGVSYPTSGNVIVKKDVGSILDLNTGFELDFTGRENIRLRFTLLGLKKNQIKELEESIIDFADIGDYIDCPIKYYSNGMKARLGFAISTHTNCEIIVIDEVLSVGDKNFREKCFNKIKELTSKESITLVLVTHLDEIAEKFCDRGIVLEKGSIVYDGDLKSSLNYYNTL